MRTPCLLSLFGGSMLEQASPAECVLLLFADSAYPVRDALVWISPLQLVIGTTMIAASMSTKIAVVAQHAVEAHDQKLSGALPYSRWLTC